MLVISRSCEVGLQFTRMVLSYWSDLQNRKGHLPIVPLTSLHDIKALLLFPPASAGSSAGEDESARRAGTTCRGFHDVFVTGSWLCSYAYCYILLCRLETLCLYLSSTLSTKILVYLIIPRALCTVTYSDSPKMCYGRRRPTPRAVPAAHCAPWRTCSAAGGPLLLCMSEQQHGCDRQWAGE